jgi:tRNA-Thr(GGU) m(6)t(6)A37 methyltransferase TsaA
MTMTVRDGEVLLAHDPAMQAHDAGLVFIGRISSPWSDRADCPKNMREARERGRQATLRLDAPYRAGTQGLAAGDTAFVLTWLDRARRDLIVQVPRHSGRPHGTFALRSPVRPNPIGLHVVRIVAVDADAGLLELDAIDVLDGTPVIDLKPYFASADVPPGADHPASPDAD